MSEAFSAREEAGGAASMAKQPPAVRAMGNERENAGHCRARTMSEFADTRHPLCKLAVLLKPAYIRLG